MITSWQKYSLVQHPLMIQILVYRSKKNCTDSREFPMANLFKGFSKLENECYMQPAIESDN
jgi:hypothetical protein